MTSPRRHDRQPLTRSDLPAEFTPESLRHISFQTLRSLAQPGNGVLDASEQPQFNAALAELTRGTASLVDESLRRARRGGPPNLDPAMRRSYQRTQQRLAEQAEDARRRFPDLAIAPVPDSSPAPVPNPPAPVVDSPPPLVPVTPTTTEAATDDHISPDTLEQEFEHNSETLDMLERIASLQQQQLEYQESKLLSETRGLFFAFLVSVAVIIAGVAPLVDAEPHERILIVVWTVAATAVAGLAYGLVRWIQMKK